MAARTQATDAWIQQALGIAASGGGTKPAQTLTTTLEALGKAVR